MLDWAGESQYYVEPKRLAGLGYLTARKEPGKTRERTVYSLTDKGLDALREHTKTPAVFTPLKSDMLLRLLLCDLVGEAPTRRAVSAIGASSPRCPPSSTRPSRARQPCLTVRSTSCS
jgi:hypothetical protein